MPAACPGGALPTLTFDARGKVAAACVTPCAAGQVYLRLDGGDLCLDPPACPGGEQPWLAVGPDAVEVECGPPRGARAAAPAAGAGAGTAALVAALLALLVLVLVLVSLYALNSSGPRWGDAPFAVRGGPF